MGRLMLWTVPRAKSTVILKALSRNPELKCIFEPFTYAYFANHYHSQFNFDQLREFYKHEPFTSDNIVLKDLPLYIENLDFESWFANKNFKHALLVRNPQDVALSTIKVGGERVSFMKSREMLNYDGSSVELHYEAMLKLKEYLEAAHEPIKVFDATDLYSDNCEQFLRSLCDFGEIPYSDEMLKMEKSKSFPKNWWTAPETTSAAQDDIVSNKIWEFHENALKATRFQHRTERLAETKSLSEQDSKDLETILKNVMPLYYKLLN